MLDETIYAQVGQVIAQIHRALDSFTSDHPRPALDVSYLAEVPLRWLSPYLHARPDDWAFLEVLAQRIQARLAYLQHEGGLTWGPIHGDATLDNLLITDNEQIVEGCTIDVDRQPALGCLVAANQRLLMSKGTSYHPAFW